MTNAPPVWEISALRKRILENQRALIEAEQELRDHDPEVIRLFEQMQEAHAAYRAKLAGKESVAALQVRQAELEQRLSELMEQTETEPIP
ncbi:MAG: hypothetical protein JW951_06260 [Lentisphaerae bacterium]|nr:hypothetical protein [Lentisphaerota bacterium]